MRIPCAPEEPNFLPVYACPGDAGADLKAATQITLAPGQRAVIGTGVKVALPAGTVGLVTPRSGRAAHQGLSIVNAPGVIDSGYRGEIKVCLINLDPRESIEIARGERIAQLVILPFVVGEFSPVIELDATERGAGGYGSTGHG
ncbi:MAG: dUTP diphosphatase [Arachnia sp.]